MYNIGKLILDGSMVVVTLWIVNKFLETFYEKKENNLFSICAWIIFAGFQIFVQMNSGIASIRTTILSIIIVILISWTGYYKFGKMNLLVIILFHVVWALVEMIVFFCMSMLPMEKTEANIIGVVISKIVMIIGVYLFSIFWRNKNNEFIPMKYFLVLLFIPIGSIYIAAEEFYSKSYNENMFPSMITFSILLLFNIVILEIYSKLSENLIFERERTVYTQQINMISRNTEEQKKLMENFHREKHDLINKLIVLKNVLEYDDKSIAIKNIEEVIKNCSIGQIISESGNKVIDALINVKYTIAKEKGIDFILKIFVPEDLPVNQCDIGIVLGNALDNAIEATAECKHCKKEIEITIGVKKEALILVVKNPYEHTLKKDKTGNLISSKKDSHRHGYGISSIMKVAEKYYGEVIIDDEDNKFVLTVTMNFGET